MRATDSLQYRGLAIEQESTVSSNYFSLNVCIETSTNVTSVPYQNETVHDVPPISRLAIPQQKSQ